MQLESSEKFKAELKRYQKKLNEIENTRTHQDMRMLIDQLINEVRAIDKQHNDLHITNSIPEGVNSSRAKIVEIRQKIERIIRDYKNS